MDLKSLYKTHPHFKEIMKLLEPGKEISIRLSGLSGSSFSVLGGNMAEEIMLTHLFVLPEKEDASYFANDLLTIID